MPFLKGMEVKAQLMSDCSGMEGAWWALKALLGDKAIHVSSCLRTARPDNFFPRCDNAIGPLKFIKANLKPRWILGSRC